MATINQDIISGHIYVTNKNKPKTLGDEAMRCNRQNLMILAYSSIIACILLVSPLFARHAIVQEPGGERLGDKLLFYCAVKFLALQHDLDFYYRPFARSDQFILSTQDAQFDDSIPQNLRWFLTLTKI